MTGEVSDCHRDVSEVEFLRKRIVELESELQDIKCASIDTEARRKELDHLLVTASMDALLLTIPDGRILSANEAACRMFGYSEEDLIKFGRSKILDETDMRLEMALGERTRTGEFHGELTFIRKDGTKFPGEISSVVFTTQDAEQRTSMVIRDISEWKETENRLYESEQFLHATIDALFSHICVLDETSTIVVVNQAWRNFAFANHPDPIKVCEGANYLAVTDTATGDDYAIATAFSAGIREVMRGEREDFSLEYPCHSPTEPRWFSGRVTRFTGKERSYLVVAHENITERKKTEDALAEYQKRLQSLASELTRSEDRERRQIALYLHDQVGQSLAAVRVKFAAWKGMTPSLKREELLSDIEQLIDQTIDDTRSLTFELSPPILYELGLGPTLEWLGENLCEKENIRFEFLDDGHSRRIEEGMASALYRIVRELLLNVAKHAQASRVSVSVSTDDTDIRLVVKDNGVGMEYSRYERALKGLIGTYGLFSIRERLHDLNGSLDIDSTPGEGTCVTVAVPICNLVSSDNGGMT